MEKKQAKTKVAAKKATSSETTVAPRGRRVEVTGEVISNKMDKTISVEVYRVIQHKKYGKFMRKSSTFKAHDEKNEAQIGDIVKIHETRPLSKTKRFALSEIVEKAKA